MTIDLNSVAPVAGGRLQDLRILDPTHPAESCRYNPFYSLDDAYQEHVNFIFRSFGLREDFFKGHQEAYLSDLVRVLQYTGRLFNVYDVLVMALDEDVLQDQIKAAKARIATLTGLSMQKRLNFEMSVKMLQRSLQDRERVEKIQGLLNELLSFLEDELSVVTGAYQDLLTLDDVLENDLILFVSLNSNRNQRAVEALGKILLQNIQLMVGKRYSQTTASRSKDEPMLSVILDEFAPFAYPGFTQVLQTARGAKVSFLFSFQSLPQLQRVSQAFADEVSSAPGTKMIMNVSEENTAQWFLKASARIATKRRSLSVRKTGIFTPKYTETGMGSESEAKETRAREDHIKNLPVGQMEILMVDSREGTLHSHLHVRRAPSYQLDGIEPVSLSQNAQPNEPRDRRQSPFQGCRESPPAAQTDRRDFARYTSWGLNMRRLLAIQLLTILLLFCALRRTWWPRRRAVQPEKTGQTQRQRQGFFDYALGKINPSNTDYGAAMARRAERSCRPHHRRSLLLVERCDTRPARLRCRDYLFRVALCGKEGDRCRHHHRGTLERPRQRQNRNCAPHRAIQPTC